MFSRSSEASICLRICPRETLGRAGPSGRKPSSPARTSRADSRRGSRPDALGLALPVHVAVSNSVIPASIAAFVHASVCSATRRRRRSARTEATVETSIPESPSCRCSMTWHPGRRDPRPRAPDAGRRARRAAGTWAERRGLDAARSSGPTRRTCRAARLRVRRRARLGRDRRGDGPQWVAEEIEWLRAADAAGLPMLGICFGAQALASALGGSVHRLPKPEIGWVTVETRDADRLPAGPWMAWHEDGFTLPPLAYELASNAFGVQSFCHCRHLAVQFHPEVTAAIVADWARERPRRSRAGGHASARSSRRPRGSRRPPRPCSTGSPRGRDSPE